MFTKPLLQKARGSASSKTQGGNGMGTCHSDDRLGLSEHGHPSGQAPDQGLLVLPRMQGADPSWDSGSNPTRLLAACS